MQKKLKYYKSLDALKILTFWKIIQENNVKLLDIDYSEDKNYTEKDIKILSDTWTNLYDNYFEIDDDPFNKSQLQNQMNYMKSETDVFFLTEIIKTIEILKGRLDLSNAIQKAYALVKSKYPSMPLKYFEGIDYNLSIINRTLNALKNKRNQLKGDIKKNVDTKIKNVYEIVNNAESWTKRPININEMVVLHWLALSKEVKQIQKQAKENGTVKS